MRSIKVQVRCMFRLHWVYYTYYHPILKKFVCRRCGDILDHNPELARKTKDEKGRIKP